MKLKCNITLQYAQQKNGSLLPKYTFLYLFHYIESSTIWIFSTFLKVLNKCIPNRQNRRIFSWKKFVWELKFHRSKLI